MFRNRGKMPDINNLKPDNEKEGYRVPHYSNYWNGRFIIVKYDKTFVAIELISVFVILLIVFAVYLFAYKTSFEDPIATIKNNFLSAQLISIFTTIGLTGIVTFLTRSSKEKLITRLRIVAIISMIVLIVLGVIKLNINKKYNKSTFGEFYEQYEKHDDKSKNTDKISIGFSGIKVSSQKQAYIDESISAYTNFSIKASIYMGIYILVIVIILYLSYRLSTIERKKGNLAKDDAILYDEEENVKL